MHSKLQYRNHKHKLNIKSRFTLICFQDHDLHTPTLVINLNIKNESKAVLVLKGQKEGGKLLQFGYFFFFSDIVKCASCKTVGRPVCHY